MALRSLLPLGVFLLLAPVLTQTAPRAADAPTPSAEGKFTKEVAPVLKQYCIGCHGGAHPKGDLNLEGFKDEKSALQRRQVWDKVADNLRSGEMPPSGKPRPSAMEIDAVTRWIDAVVTAGDCGKPRDPGRVTLRRLNRAEYNNTIRDLLGVPFQPADDFPADDVGYGFDNIGDVLSLSPLLMEKYLAAAEKVVDLAFKSPEARGRILIATPAAKGKQEAARLILENFARRAYRRPVAPDEIARLKSFVDLAEKNGDNFDRGIQLALQATLVSPHFLFRVEKDRKATGTQKGNPISEYELASRLSYFLWSSMPDEELFRLAGQGELRKHLEAQVKRMLADPKARALVDNFAGQWLQLRSVAQVTPDPTRFPGFDEPLRAAMRKETELFVEAIIKEDRSILEFLDANFTFVNERLARHYGIPDVKGDHFRRVTLPEARGGLLTQASILTVTSNPTRTSPVKRGKWVLENILGTPPPPPPPDAGELSEAKEAALSASLRQRMELHRSKEICASCHQRMDPLGFGLENFDGIGAWRTQDGKFPVDASGTLPGGQTFNGPKELRKVLLTREAEFRQCLTEKLLTFALGRGLEYYDRCAVEDISAAVARNQYHFSSLVLAIVRSEPFQMRRAK